MFDLFSNELIQKFYVLVFSILISLLSPQLQSPSATSTISIKQSASTNIQPPATVGGMTKQKGRVNLGVRDGVIIASTTADTSSEVLHEDSGETTTVEPGTQLQEGYLVTDIVDGDTIKVTIDGTTETLRIIGINTPETVDPRRPVQCFGKEASDKAKELLDGQYVTLERDMTQDNRDKYGRLLRFVFINGDDYGKEMIREGYAYEYTYNIPYKYQAEYKEAQRRAKGEGNGLWRSGVCNELTNSKSVQSFTQSTIGAGVYYTSSKSNAKNYYPSYCSAWKNLSATYLQSFSTLEELLSVYPSRVISKQCE
jgi:micrococcal nuclease